MGLIEFLKKDCDKLVKYDVQFDVEKLELVRKEIIKNCGIRQHCEYQTDYPEHLSKDIETNLKKNQALNLAYQEEYKDAVRAAFKMKLIGTIPYDEYERVMKFIPKK